MIYYISFITYFQNILAFWDGVFMKSIISIGRQYGCGGRGNMQGFVRKARHTVL